MPIFSLPMNTPFDFPVFLCGAAPFSIGGIAVREPMRQSPGPKGMQIDRPADAAKGLGGGGRLDDIHLVEQRGRQRSEVGLWRVDLIRRNEYFTVQHSPHLGQPAYVHGRSNATVAVDLHAGDTLQRVRDGHVRQLPDALRRNAVLDTIGEALDLDRLYLRLPYADDGNSILLQLLRALGSLVQLDFLGVGRWRRRHVLLRRGTWLL